jgi:hypothetical protein
MNTTRTRTTYHAGTLLSKEWGARIVDEVRREFGQFDFGPTEFGGFLFGRISAPMFGHRSPGTLIVESAVPAMIEFSRTSRGVGLDFSQVEELEERYWRRGQAYLGNFHSHPSPFAAVPSQNDLRGWTNEAFCLRQPYLGLIISPSGQDANGSDIWSPLRYSAWVAGSDPDKEIVPACRLSIEIDRSRDWLWER